MSLKILFLISSLFSLLTLNIRFTSSKFLGSSVGPKSNPPTEPPGLVTTSSFVSIVMLGLTLSVFNFFSSVVDILFPKRIKIK